MLTGVLDDRPTAIGGVQPATAAPHPLRRRAGRSGSDGCRAGASRILVVAELNPESIVVHDSTGFSFRGNQIRGHYSSGFEQAEQLIGLASAGRIDLAPSVAAHIPPTEVADATTRPERKIGDPIRFVLPLKPAHPGPGPRLDRAGLEIDVV